MLLRRKIKAVLITWLLAEAGLFAVGVGVFGWLIILLATVSTAFVGGVVLSRSGSQLAFSLMDIMARPTAQASGTRHLATVLAGILLILPGFLTDFAALILFVPPIRDIAIRRIFPVEPRRSEGTIDLDRDQWRSL